MIKLLIIFFVLLMILMLLLMRYRRQLQAGLQIWRMYKQIRKTPKSSPPQKEVTQKVSRGESLVRCARCGKWVAPAGAISLRAKTFYCSTQCMEKAARLESLVDRK